MKIYFRGEVEETRGLIYYLGKKLNYFTIDTNNGTKFSEIPYSSIEKSHELA